MQHQLIISHNPQANMNCDFQVLEHMLCSNPMNLPRFNDELDRSINHKIYIVSSMIFTRYIRETNQHSINKKVSTNAESSMYNFIFGTMSGQGYAIQHLKSLQDIDCVLTFPKEDLICIFQMSISRKNAQGQC